MKKSIKQVLVVVNPENTQAQAVLAEVEQYFQEKQIRTVIQVPNGALPAQGLTKLDLALSLGGDGTLLFCAAVAAPLNIPILAVNLGSLGFITETLAAEWKQALEKYANGKLGISERTMLSVELRREGERQKCFSGLNDAVVGTSGISRLVGLKLYLSGSFAGRYRADGVIVSTATGSTAYSMGAGGPILHPEMKAFILNPICPFTLSNRPLIVPINEVIEIQVEEYQRTDVILCVDGKDLLPLLPNDKIIIKKAAFECHIIRSDKRDFYEVLRSKLNWSGEPHA